MRIKKLEIHGFKSFADRAVLVFGDGISGVVGPNGCGKSNVVDAIRWCMGEMSAKHLRGKAMQDVIFAGSDSRGPQGLAEVTLTFQNDGNVPPAFAAYPEIAITRRLHRDGTSEYLINKTPSRLRDITDFFLGTGVGTRAYSIIEQGRIGFIVNAKPEERRSLIEEVAGITKFKARKKAAERRMDATHQNLLRVNDILSELERQLASLRRQARKAERYRELRREVRDLELHVASVEMLKLAAVEHYQHGEQKNLELRLEDAQGSMVAIEAAVEADKLRLLEEEQRLQADQVASAEMDAKLAALERDLEHWQQQRIDLQTRAEQGSRDVVTAQQRLEATAAEEARLRTEASQLGDSLGDDRGRLDDIAREADERQRQIARLDSSLETLRGEAVEHIHRSAQNRSVLATLERQRADTERRLEQATTDMQTVTARRAEVAAGLARLGEELAQHRATLDGWRHEYEERNQALAHARDAVRVCSARVQSIRDDLSERGSRLASLQEIARRLEGFSDGVRTLMGGGDEPVIDGIRAVAPEIMEVPEAFEVAVEAALGERLQFLIVDDHRVARDGIDHLRRHEGGRGGFIPRVPWTTAPGHLPEGVIGRLAEQVKAKPGFEDTVAGLFRDCVVVDSLEAALSIPEASRPSMVVTLSGEAVDRFGAVIGGTNDGSGVLANRREIRELTDVVAELERSLADARADLTRAEGGAEALEERLAELDTSLREGELTLLEKQKDLESLRAEERRANERDEVLRYELEQHREELARIGIEETRATSALTEDEKARETIEMKIASVTDERRRIAAELEERSQILTGLRVNLAAREEKVSAAEQGLARLETTRQELRERMARGRQEVGESEDMAAELDGKIDSAQRDRSEMSSEADERRRALGAARSSFDQGRQALSEREQRIRTERRQSELVQEALVELRLDLQRLRLERERLSAQVRERHDVILAEVLTDYHTRPQPGPDQLKRQKELDRQIKAMGAINLTAIDECAEIEERFSFLARQRDDLDEAMENLRRAIQRINKASRERFKEAYEAVNEMFQQVYPRLFRGGIARLELTNADDLLEAGVDIIAQPPGKKLQNVNLMSGGEKALTATAFIFSIFLIKPSPFCILDEVDAPLDEANVGRFNEMLQEISGISQFIVITHNKATMTQADRLYGITMQEPGMSTVVPVELGRPDIEGDEAA
ncbi:MAG: chromosome segregation protein SMC [Myxococcota bacterium]